jgi:preprotein translocase subunit Sss1
MDSWRLLQKCTKPDAKGMQLQCSAMQCNAWHGSLCSARALEADLCWSASPSPVLLSPPSPPLPTTEFKRIAMATTVGFLVMGFIGFFVKLIHIPINNIIVGA